MYILHCITYKFRFTGETPLITAKEKDGTRFDFTKGYYVWLLLKYCNFPLKQNTAVFW